MPEVSWPLPRAAWAPGQPFPSTVQEPLILLKGSWRPQVNSSLGFYFLVSRKEACWAQEVGCVESQGRGRVIQETCCSHGSRAV